MKLKKQKTNLHLHTDDDNNNNNDTHIKLFENNYKIVDKKKQHNF